MSKNSYLRHFSAQVSQIVYIAYLTILCLITTVWPEMSKNSYLLHFSAQLSQIMFLAIWPFYVLLQLYDLKCQKTHIFATSIHRYQNLLHSIFDRFTSYYNCMTWNVKKLISPPFQCTSITNRFLSVFDRLTAYYNCITWNVWKFISPPFQCTTITNYVPSVFDRIPSYYNCMTWNVKKLITSPF